MAGLVLLNVMVVLALPACTSPSSPAELTPTLSFKSIAGSRIAMQDGIPVPTFSYQPRRRLDLSGKWRVEVMPMDDDLSLTPRSSGLKQIVADAASRQQPLFDDTRWPLVDVPGAFNQPPSVAANGAWYRKD